MLLNDADPSWQLIDCVRCPHCQAIVAKQLILSPHCGRALKGLIRSLVDTWRGTATWLKILACIVEGRFIGCMITWMLLPASMPWAVAIAPGSAAITLFAYLMGHLLTDRAQERTRQRDEHSVHVSYDE